jgi:hypothetical protein
VILNRFATDFLVLIPLGRRMLVPLLWLSRFRPVLRPAAIPARRASECDYLGHLKAHFFLDDFSQGNVRGTKIANIRQEWPARAPIAGV